MEFIYCLEEDAFKIMDIERRKAQQEKKNVNLIPQFVGMNPIVCSCGKIGESYSVKILLPKRKI